MLTASGYAPAIMRAPRLARPTCASSRTRYRACVRLAVGLLAPAFVALTACGGASTKSANGAKQTKSGSSSQPQPAPSLRPDNVGVTFPPIKLCEYDSEGQLLNPIEPGHYTGLLRTARCDQQKFLIMARVSDALGVDCSHCHVPHPTDAKTYLYLEETENKDIARWMEATFIRGLVRKDGKAMRCASCHRDDADKPSAKLLGDPRDMAQAQVWMHEVMTTKFSHRNSDRLRCSSCHVGSAPGLPGWTPDVIAAITLGPEGLMRQ